MEENNDATMKSTGSKASRSKAQVSAPIHFFQMITPPASGGFADVFLTAIIT